MAARKKNRAPEALLASEALSIEGGLLSPQWLSRVAQLGAGGQSESDYRIPKGLNLRDEIGRYWRIAQALWSDFAAGRTGTADARMLAERFVLALLRDGFGFASLVKKAPVVLAERSYPIGFASLDGRVPVVIAPAGSGLDSLAPAFGDGSRRRSPFGLAQEYLNVQEGALWGLATDGVTLRMVRDNASLTRPAWIEADLQRIFTEERYPDFTALWLLAHETRFGRSEQPVTECALETWRNAGREEGTRAREHLRRGVEDALIALGQGFLSHPDNQVLRAALQSGALSTKDCFNQLLRLIYRLIFLLTVEERGLLHPDGAAETARSLYAEGYGLKRLRERSVKRNAHDRFSDLWEATKIVFRGVATGEPRLGLPALAGIFSQSQCPFLDAAKLENRALLLAVFKLAWLRDDGSLARVNWRDMGPEELGSVYESLLELVPQITQDGRQFAFATGGETKGNARKTTGSYYTPDSLVQVLVDSALEPVVKDTIAKNPDKPMEALLALSIVDPACGSGHFLLAAARRLAVHVARLQANGTPSMGEYRHALRQVVGRCIYGVDLNPMAVELCKVSLWMEAVEPGLPLTFLNSHIQHGNSLLGTTPELMGEGIPDVAWEPIEGDDKKTASALKKRNKMERTSPNLSFEFSTVAEGATVAILSRVQALDLAPDFHASEIERKDTTWRELLASEQFRSRRLAADAWCAAFVWPKKPGDLAEFAPTHGEWERLRHTPELASPRLVEQVEQLAAEYHLFHWHMQFPQVFAKGGFDVVLGNPPWEHVELKEEEWFAARRPDIAAAPNAATRKRRIEQLSDEDPRLFHDFQNALRSFDGESRLMRSSGRFPLCATGRINTYAIFAEHNRAILGACGRAGFIVPTGIATDDTTKEYFGTLVRGRELVRFFSFENEEFVFPGVHHAFKFALLTVARAGDAPAADLVFFARQIAALSNPLRHFSLSPADFETLNPNTQTCPTFRSRRDADINLAIYRRTGILWREGDESDGNPWGLRFMQGVFNMASDSGLFKTRAELETSGHMLIGNRFVAKTGEHLPLIEAKMVHHFDHRFGTYEGQTEAQDNQGKLPEFDETAHTDASRLTHPYYWVAEREVRERLSERWRRGWLLGWRRICRSTDQRTLIAALFPLAGVGDSEFLAISSADPAAQTTLYANLTSFAFDYAARQKIGGTNASFHIIRQLPCLAPPTYGAETPWQRPLPLRDWIVPRVLELAYTAWDLEPFAHDIGYDGAPFRWDRERRFLLRCELDAAFFHLYGLSRDDTDYVMDTFPIVRKNDEKVHGEYRTKRTILDIYDGLAAAARTREPYRTRLDPPPADQRVAHPDRGAQVIPLRPATGPLPAVIPAASVAPDLAAVGADEWTRPHANESGEIQAAVLAVLRACGAPTDRRHARLAALLCLEPHLVVSHLDDAERANWARVVGADARKAVNASVDNTTQAWGVALSGLRARGRLIEDLQQNTWAIGIGTDAIDTRGWADGRAGFMVSVLRRLQTSTSIDAIVLKLPTAIRQWFPHAA